MTKDQRSLLGPLLGINVAMIACPVLLASSMAWGDLSPVLGGILLLGSYPLFVLLFAALSWTAWWSVSFRRMPKMEAWWWLSVPYSAALPMSILAFRLQYLVAHVLVLFVLFGFLAALSSATWALMTIYQVAVSRKTELTTKKKTMLAIVLLGALLWIASIVSRG